MRICFLADGPNVHTQKWVSFFANREHEVHLITFHHEEIPGVITHPVKRTIPVAISPVAPSWFKIGYLFYLHEVKKRIWEIAPDIVHAHWASSYGLMGAYSSFHPFVLSTWGSDVFDFPHRSFLHKKILEYTMNRADYLTATSQMLTEETKKYLKEERKVHTIPFGVDLELFKPREKKGRDRIVIGTVRRLEKKYGVEYLIRAFASLLKKGFALRLHVIGTGSEERRLKGLSQELQVENNIRFFGFVKNSCIPDYLNQMDIFVVPSIMPSETFGVAAVEAAACQLPVIASHIGGLPEVVRDGETGFLVPPRDPEAIAERVGLLIKDFRLRKRMGEAARGFIVKNYSWKENALQMERLYQLILSNKE